MPAPVYTFSLVNSSISLRYYTTNADGTIIMGPDRYTDPGTITISKNSGVTFSDIVVPGITIPASRHPIRACACSSSGEIIYVLCYDYNVSTGTQSGNYYRLFKSINSGTTFTLQMNGLPNDIDNCDIICNSTGTNILLYIRDSSINFKVYFSTNAGSSFTESTLATGASTLPISATNIMTMSSDGSIMYIKVDSGNNTSSYSSIYKSTNSGANFSEIYADYGSSGNPFVVQSMINIICNTTGSILYVTGSTTSPATEYKLFKSTNSGVTWSDISVPTITIQSINTISCDVTGTILCISLFRSDITTNQNEVYISNDSGSTWGKQLFTGSPMLDSPMIMVTANGAKFYVTDYDIPKIYSYLTVEQVPVPCFTGDAKILCKIDGVEKYVPIQNLRSGVLVKTLKDGFKPIDMIGKREFYHPASDERIGEQLYVCTKEKYPELTEDLVLTGGHAILVSAFKNNEQRQMVEKAYGKIYITDDRYRLPASVDDRTDIYNIPGTYTVYHIYIASDNYNNYGIYANGLLVETSFEIILNYMTLL